MDFWQAYLPLLCSSVANIGETILFVRVWVKIFLFKQDLAYKLLENTKFCT